MVVGPKHIKEKFISQFNHRFTLGTIAHGSGLLRFYALKLVQNDDFTISINGDDKLNALETFPISRPRRKQTIVALNKMYLVSFRSVNSSIGWLDITKSHFC